MEELYSDFRHTTYLHIAARHINRDVNENIAQVCRHQFERRWHPNIGYIQPGSLSLIRRSKLESDGSTFGGQFRVECVFSCRRALPVPGTEMLCMITSKSEIVALGKLGPIDVILPIDENIQATDISHVRQGDWIRIQVASEPRIYNENKCALIGRYLGSVQHVKYRDLHLPQYSVVLDDLIQSISINTTKDFPKEWDEPSYIDEEVDIFNSYRSKTEQIEDIDRKKWEVLRELINPYAFVSKKNRYLTNPLVEISVTRSFFKTYEMIWDLNLLSTDEPQRILCFLSDLGGIASSVLHRRREIVGDQIMCIKSGKASRGRGKKSKEVSIGQDWEALANTITSYPDDFPELEIVEKFSDEEVDHTQVLLELVEDLTSTETLATISSSFNNEKIDFIVADATIPVTGLWGEFGDSPKNNNYQEQINNLLTLGECITALSLQKPGKESVFILKLFDSMSKFTVKLMYLVSMIYNNVRICKPYTSRPASSERYVLCQGFKGLSEESIRHLVSLWQGVKEDFSKHDVTTNSFQKYGLYLSDLDNVASSDEFDASISNVNVEFLKTQVRKITEALEMNKSAVYETDVKRLEVETVKNSERWCEEYQLDCGVDTT